MLVHLLALLDILAAGTILGGHLHLFRVPLLYAAIYFVTKLFFFRDILSIIDACAALYCVFIFFGVVSSGLTWFFMLYFLYKTSIWVFYAFV